MLASLTNPLLILILTSQQLASTQAHALLPKPQDLANPNQQPLQRQQQQQQQQQQQPTITSHTTLTLYTTTSTITVPNTREAMQTSLSSFAEDAGEAYEEVDREVNGCDEWQCAGCRSWYLCSADEEVEW